MGLELKVLYASDRSVQLPPGSPIAGVVPPAQLSSDHGKVRQRSTKSTVDDLSLDLPRGNHQDVPLSRISTSYFGLGLGWPTILINPGSAFEQMGLIVQIHAVARWITTQLRA